MRFDQWVVVIALVLLMFILIHEIIEWRRYLKERKQREKLVREVESKMEQEPILLLTPQEIFLRDAHPERQLSDEEVMQEVLSRAFHGGACYASREEDGTVTIQELPKDPS